MKEFMPSAIICDLDGTLCDHSHRLHYVDVNEEIKLETIEFFHVLDSKEPHYWRWKNTLKRWKPDYESYYGAMADDGCHDYCRTLLRLMRSYYKIIFVTGRPEEYRDVTITWINEHTDLIGWGALLYMRPDFLPSKCCGGNCTNVEPSPDHRPSPIIKEEIFLQDIKPHYNVLFVLEDDERCARMYKSHSLTVLQVI
jgi:phosphoglycolate phosphatase-like HAD superfamily hydrolase